MTDWYQPTGALGVPTMNEMKESIRNLLNQLEAAIVDQNLTLQVSLVDATRKLIEQAERSTVLSSQPAILETPGSNATAEPLQQRRPHRKRRTL